jgi:hypothetical protein
MDRGKSMGSALVRREFPLGRAIHLLTKGQIESTRSTLCDGGGLYLVRKGNGAAASWIFRFARQGKSHDLGLGPWPEISLTRARDKAFELRRKLAEGVDVLAERGRTQPAAPAIAVPAAPVKAMTFADAAMAYIAGQEAGWTPASTFQWTASLRNLAFPIIGAMPVSKIDTPDVLRVLQPIWTTKATTAGRIRGRIERILDWAKVHGHRSGGENPARWDGHLANVLPAKSRVATIEHFEAVPVAAVPAFMERLRAGARVYRAVRGPQRRGARRDVVRDRHDRGDVDDTGCSDEGAPATRRRALFARSRHLGRDAEGTPRRSRILWYAQRLRRAARGRAAHAQDRRGRQGARAALVVPRLVRRDRPGSSACRDVPRAQHRQRGRAVLCPVKPAGAAPRLDAGVGGLLRRPGPENLVY